MILRVSGDRIFFWCPGCNDIHGIQTGANGWTWNGSLDRPTFTPSVLVGGTQWAEDDHFYKPTHRVAPGQKITCHSFVTDGRIQFLSDSTHELSNQTVPMGPLPAYLEKEPV